ncbi:MAG: hypothetical protein ACI9IA_002093, partial [Enterobacterales bacterium]
YHCAEAQCLNELENPSNSLKNAFSIVDMTYLRICLLSLSNPYHLKRGDHWEVFIYLFHWAIHSSISKNIDDFSKKNCFVIDLSGDDKPQWVKELVNKNNPNYRFLLTLQLNLKLIRNIDNIEVSNKTIEKCFSHNVISKKAIELLDNMHSGWECIRERQAPRSRYPKISKMEVIWGLEDIHKVISASEPLEVSKTAAELEKITEVVEHQWATINSSDDGASIAHPSVNIRKIDVGLLVGIRKTISDGTRTTWSLGIICWITGNQKRGTQVGIQYLKGVIQAVQLQPRKGNNVKQKFQQALLLSGEKVSDMTDSTLLTQTNFYIKDRPMLLKTGEEELFIDARLKVDSLGIVDRFFYELANQQLNSDNKKTMAKNSEPDNADVSQDTEVIDLLAMPSTSVEDLDKEYEEHKKKAEQDKIKAEELRIKAQEEVVTFEDMIVTSRIVPREK